MPDYEYNEGADGKIYRRPKAVPPPPDPMTPTNTVHTPRVMAREPGPPTPAPAPAIPRRRSVLGYLAGQKE